MRITDLAFIFESLILDFAKEFTLAVPEYQKRAIFCILLMGYCFERAIAIFECGKKFIKTISLFPGD